MCHAGSIPGKQASQSFDLLRVRNPGRSDRLAFGTSFKFIRCLNWSSRDTNSDRIVWNIPGNDGACTNDTVVPYRYTRKNNCVVSDEDIIPDSDRRNDVEVRQPIAKNQSCTVVSDEAHAVGDEAPAAKKDQKGLRAKHRQACTIDVRASTYCYTEPPSECNRIRSDKILGPYPPDKPD